MPQDEGPIHEPRVSAWLHHSKSLSIRQPDLIVSGYVLIGSRFDLYTLAGELRRQLRSSSDEDLRCGFFFALPSLAISRVRRPDDDVE